MIRGISKLTPAIRRELKKGTKVRFKWHGSDKDYIGRIEVREKMLFFCAEHNYDGNELTETGKGLQYYNILDSFYHFTEFEILQH